MSILKVRNNSIKTLSYVILFALSAYLFNCCEDEKSQARSYSRVRTNPVSGITSNGATFNGEIFSLGTEPITDHGFVWSEGHNPTLNDDKIQLGPKNTSGAYSAEILSTLEKDAEYTVKSFVRTGENVFYGLPVTFTSLGSGAPVILGFEPDSAAWLDTIKISGKNFSYGVKNNLVKLNQTACSVISATDTVLTVEVSPFITKPKNAVSVEITGNLSVFKGDSLRFIPPVLTDFSPKKAYWGDTLHLKGKHFKAFSSKKENAVYLGSFKCEKIGPVTDTLISVKVPFELTHLNSDVRININGLNIFAIDKFELLSPYYSFTPKSGTWGNTVTMTGRFNTQALRTNVFFNSVEATIISVSINSLKIKVPQSLSDIKSVLIYESDPFIIRSVDTFRLAAPVINSFLPSSGPPGTIVTIKGKYFDVIAPVVKFGEVNASISSNNDSIIVAVVPTGSDGNVRISVVSRSQTVTSTDYFNVTNPKITNVVPLSGTFNDEITISGQGFISPFGSTTVTFDGISAVIKSLSATSLVVLVPPEIDSIPRLLTVTSGIVTVSSVGKFVLSPHQVNSVSPGGILAGQDITITGTGFNPDPARNAISWDNYTLVIKSATKTEIVATWPQSLPRGSNKLKVVVGGYSRFSSLTFSSDSQWLRIAAPEIPTTFPFAYYYGISNYGKSLKNLGYICSEANGSTYRFDPADNSWTDLNIPSPFDSYWHNIKMAEVVCRDTFYLIGGHYNGYSMKAFDDINNTWKNINPPAQMSGVAFSLYDNLYFGLDFYSPSSYYFFKCDPANGYSWARTGGNYSYINTNIFTTYFSIGTKGYVVFSDNSVWEFNPDNLSYPWGRVADFPGSARELAFSFVLGDKAYVGGGKSMDYLATEYSDIWMYYPFENSWTLVSNIPQARHSAVAFSIGNKAYIGFGLHMTEGFQNNLYDFYEFDPNYPAK